ncbi:MAG: AAA family ATPase [Bacteroidetes bacterium]|nr:AAA family ATPase [Bacteroidota bacterium]MCL2302940.1 AAA family ATPase [Lentimicrobiaceae bacterium]
MKRALSVRDIMTKKYETIPFTGQWLEAFGMPERTGVWIIWGNSGNGKSTFALQLCTELCKHGKVLYNSLEEGSCLTFRKRLELVAGDMDGKRFNVVSESVDELSKRLLRQRSADFVVIDSFQYSGLSYPAYRQFKDKHPNKLLIFISHAEGSRPAGRSAKSVLYDASQKIWIEGFKAISNGRSIGANGGTYTIWEDSAMVFHGCKS